MLREKNPSFLNEFLDYSSTIQNKAKGTIKEYNFDLYHFIQYLVYRFDGSRLKGHAKDAYDSGSLTLAEAIKSVDISNVGYDILEKVELQDIHAFLHHLKSELNLKPASLGRKVACIRSFFTFECSIKKKLDKNPTVGLETPKQPKRLPRHLDLNQSMKLLEATSTPNSDSKVSEKLTARNTAIITLFLNCGIRLSELVSINMKHLNFYDNTLSVIGKGNKERTLYLNKACLTALKEYLKTRPTDIIDRDKDALFISERKSRISRRTVQHIVKTELAKAGINSDDYSVHKLRHTAATLMFQYGDVDIRSLQKVLGHESVSTTEIYTHVNNQQVRNAINNNPLADVMDDD